MDAAFKDQIAHLSIGDRSGGYSDNDTTVEHQGLCQSCSTLFQATVCFNDSRDHRAACRSQGGAVKLHSSWKQLQVSARNGCRLCNVIESEAQRSPPANASADDIISIWCMRKDFRAGSMTWDIRRYGPKVSLTEKQHAKLELSLPRSYSRYRPVPKTTGSPAALATLKSWIAECTETHEACKVTSSQTQVLPTRLIGLANMKEDGIVKLVNGLELDPGTDYITLSHRWGMAESMKLDDHSYESFRNGIKAGDIPRLYRDTCELAMDLGITYLWIDSICIKQDSHEDWLKEGAKMADVYAKSFLNIAANVATDSTGSLYNDRNPLALSPCSISASCECTSSKVWTVSPPISSSKGSLERRGWVVQELLLPTRVASFNNDEIKWTCNTAKYTEHTPESDSLKFMYDMDGGWRKSANMKIDMRKPSKRQNQKADGNEDLAHSPLLNWQRIIQWQYSTADLTFQKDKLIAISGIAKKTFERSEGSLGRYSAGVWETKLMSQLMWRSWDGSCRRQDEYQAPSWSWASLRGPVAWNVDAGAGGQKTDSEVLSVWTTQTGSDEYGPVSGGCLTMAARLCKIGLTMHKYKYLNTATNNLRFGAGDFVELDQQVLKTPGWSMAQSEFRDHVTFREGVKRHEQSDLGIIPDDSEEWRKISVVSREPILYVLLLLHGRHDYQGLVLEPVEAQDVQGRFRRVGKVEALEYNFGETFWQACMTSQLDTTKYKTIDAQGRYVIEIV